MLQSHDTVVSCSRSHDIVVCCSRSHDIVVSCSRSHDIVAAHIHDQNSLKYYILLCVCKDRDIGNHLYQIMYDV